MTLTALGIRLQHTDWLVYASHSINYSHKVLDIAHIVSCLGYFSHHLITEIQVGFGLPIPLSHVITDYLIALKLYNLLTSTTEIGINKFCFEKIAGRLHGLTGIVVCTDL